MYLHKQLTELTKTIETHTINAIVLLIIQPSIPELNTMNKLNDISQKRFSQTTWFKQEYDIEVMHTLVDKRAQ